MDSMSWKGLFGASFLVGAAVFGGTLVYLIDRIGWALGVILGLAPALLLGLLASVGHLVVALVGLRRTVPVGALPEPAGRPLPLLG